ncbi:TrmH family RNA methyltransferase [Bizionia paragorgiae]|uniref:SpoU rRNA Methylase family protein n=1 Tax=Bizionia paragorgiae TaxID=283786 RepID=A0A1H3WY26_BIZPA|nr:TrmH family RNA methyltransferase [Bizionia paragorgiae]MDX1271974.1 TrmH family RNA methyltransferase [Bizionia paragorgiae]SDZ92046.1 SpoU rRNA Methylase family protein [Bizionia paragorgiae]
MQLNHDTTNFESKTFPITIVCENVTNAPNIGSLFRISDAFGVAELIFCGSHIPLGRKMMKTSRATEKVVPYKVCENAAEVIADLKAKNYYIVALEITKESTAIDHFKFPTNQPIALIIGDENFGVSEHNLKASDASVHITMYGQNSSMNVVQAANIALYEITKQLV